MSKENKNEKQIQINAPEFYTNATLTNFSPYEFEVTLGLNGSNFKGPRPLATVRMSPQFAKEFAQTLMNNVRLYEEKFGEIITPEKPANSQSIQ